MTLLDCALLIFSNFPSRFSVTEMKFHLPSEETFWSSDHPFSRPGFKTSRQLTTYEAFKSLFAQDKSPLPEDEIKRSNPLGLNPMDMFILIHCKSIDKLYFSSFTDFLSALRLHPHSNYSFPALPFSICWYFRTFNPSRRFIWFLSRVESFTHQRRTLPMADTLDYYPR